jgi:hypothetical protein
MDINEKNGSRTLRTGSNRQLIVRGRAVDGRIFGSGDTDRFVHLDVCCRQNPIRSGHPKRIRAKFVR